LNALVAVNPFVGLRPFEADDALLFFGRQQQTAELVRKLNESRFVAVVGSSGCGKSSLVRAGLIPKLQAGFLVEDRDEWFVAKMKPGSAPIDNLAAAAGAAGDGGSQGGTELTAERIREGGVQALLDRFAKRLKEDDCNLLLLVDQFEELFRFDLLAEAGRGMEEASDFVSIMLALAEQRDAPIYVIMTMRSDFLGECDRFHGLPETMNRTQYLVPRLGRQQRREAIEGPIRLYGGEITSRLIDRLLNETIDTRDDLPVLQHALMRTWERCRTGGGGPVDVDHYEQIGTIHEALSRDADAALEGLDGLRTTWAKRLFQLLTRVDSGNRRIRRPAKLNDVAERTGASPAAIWEIVERFRHDGRSFLIVSSEDPRRDPLIDISHESLIRQWKTLREWVDEEAESLNTYRRLVETAALHQRGRAGLYTDPDLQVALDWQERESPNQAWGRGQGGNFDEALAFLRESKQARDEIRAEAEFRRRWRRPRAAIAAFVLALFFFNLGLHSVGDFWGGARQNITTMVEGLGFKHAHAEDDLASVVAHAAVDMFRIGAHIGLFVLLAFLGKRLYRALAFPSIAGAVATQKPKNPRLRESKVRIMRRIIENVAKWTSLVVGVLVMGTCSLVGANQGGASSFLGMSVVGLVIALLLVGWVFAVARLNADVKSIRKQLPVESDRPEVRS
jgi:hypothetical protein